MPPTNRGIRTPQAEAAVALSRYVPSIAVRWDEVAPGRQWHEIDGTLCFVDISGFTSLSERLARRGRIGAEELTDVLNRVFSAMLRTAYDYGGSLIKFGGDALLLLFQGDDHAVREASAVTGMSRPCAPRRRSRPLQARSDSGCPSASTADASSSSASGPHTASS